MIGSFVPGALCVLGGETASLDPTIIFFLLVSPLNCSNVSFFFHFFYVLVFSLKNVIQICPFRMFFYVFYIIMFACLNCCITFPSVAWDVLSCVGCA
jgi:hypothetical protein